VAGPTVSFPRARHRLHQHARQLLPPPLSPTPPSSSIRNPAPSYGHFSSSPPPPRSAPTAPVSLPRKVTGEPHVLPSFFLFGSTSPSPDRPRRFPCRSRRLQPPEQKLSRVTAAFSAPHHWQSSPVNFHHLGVARCTPRTPLVLTPPVLEHIVAGAAVLQPVLCAW
jgi:hypothetical protein